MTTTAHSNEAALHTFRICGISIQAYDQLGSKTLEMVASELAFDTYGLRRVAFADGDCVLDIGAHVGLFSILLAKLNPSLRIYAYEPFPANHDLCGRNLELNGVSSVVLSQCALSGDGRLIELGCSRQNSGSATCNSHNLNDIKVSSIPSITLDQAMKAGSIDRCKLMKIDCEGSEHEILLASSQLHRIEYLSGEFHINKNLVEQGYSFKRLYEHCERFVDRRRMWIKYCEMSF